MSTSEPSARSQVENSAAEALRRHALARGKVQLLPKCAIRDFRDFAVWYTPGVAAPCRAIQAEPDMAYEYTNKGNSIAIISDGTRVLGLGDIGPAAALPVMEGKALLFKYLGGVDAVPLCLGTKDPAEFVRTVRLLAPSFGGINLEDIAQPKCFRILEALRSELDIPVWHDDQQGSAMVVLAGLLGALRIADKSIRRVKIALVGVGAAGVATFRLLRAAGADPARMVACDSKGTLHRHRHDIDAQQHEFAEKWRICVETNAEALEGGIAEALREADVCIAFAKSDPNVIKPEWISSMAGNAIVFACANPIPEIWPDVARSAGARIVGTGRSDFPNQVNNTLAFPGVFRGALDVRASAITDEMTLAAAYELANYAAERGLTEEAILPRMDDPEVVARVATAMKAQEQGIAKLARTRAQLRQAAAKAVDNVRRATRLLMQAELIPTELHSTAPGQEPVPQLSDGTSEEPRRCPT
ncbi:MAG: NADP-dependent malic enzyme [Isosphaeraceae bacterium]|nr:NADP-dependent malic enzyme [Isosphaeraceae bacterium]